MAGFGSGVRASAVVAVVALAVCTPAAAQTPDACPNGWSPEATVEFAPPVPAVDSGVVNVERDGGCTLLDDIWAAEPFRSHAAFVEHVVAVTRGVRARGTAEPGATGGRSARRHALRRGRPRTTASSTTRARAGSRSRSTTACPSTGRRRWQILRDKQVHGVFYDNGFRVAANPQHRGLPGARGPHPAQPHLHPPAPQPALGRRRARRGAAHRGPVPARSARR